MTIEDDKLSNSVNVDAGASRYPVEVVVPHDISSEVRKLNGRIYWRTIRFALIQQTIVLGLVLLLLDGGDTFLLSIVAAALSWIPALIILRRGIAPRYFVLTKVDVVIIKYGLWICVLLMTILYNYRLLPSKFYFPNRLKKPQMQPVTQVFNAEIFCMRPDKYYSCIY
jgi:hypothetical protein